jgi:hypothetical protein
MVARDKFDCMFKSNLGGVPNTENGILVWTGTYTHTYTNWGLMFITFSYILAIRFIRGDKPDIMYWPVKLVLVRWMEFLTHEVL